MVRSLEQLAHDKNELDRLFAYDFAGDVEPEPFPPHGGDWDDAGRHWVDFNARILKTDAVDRRLGGGKSTRAAERYSQFILWVLVSAPLHYCPQCGGVRQPSPRENRTVHAAAKQDLASGLERDIPPSLEDLLKAILLDLYPTAPHAAVVVVARGLRLMAGFAAGSGLLSRQAAGMAATALHTQMVAAHGLERASFAVEEAGRRALAYAHRRLTGGEEETGIPAHTRE
jgi:hypothetical protein